MTVLVEREREIAQIAAAVDTCADGIGRLLLVEGPAGAGKSALLADAAHTAPLRSLKARGGELERELPFGVVRQLFESDARADPDLLSGAAELARAALAPRSSEHIELGGVLHGLYWLFANLAEREPLLVCVDDLQWADEPSLQFLSYLARRLEELPVTLLTAVRTGEPDAPVEALAALREAAAAVLRPQPLTVDGARRLLGAVDDATARAAHDVTGGNPFLLTEVRRSLREGVPIDQPPERVAERTVVRLRRLGAEATALAEAIAVLGGEAEPRDAAALAELSHRAALAGGDQLAAAGLTVDGLPLRFLHPLVRTAVYEAIPAGRRAQLHAAAAKELAAAGDVDRAAVHLLATPPAGDTAAADALAQAATNALSAGAPAQAVAFARRALAEPPPPELRYTVLVTLARAATRIGLPEGPQLVREALDLSPDLESRIAMVRELALMLVHAGMVAVSCDLLERELDRLADDEREARLVLEGELAGIAQFDATRIDAGAERVERVAGGLRGDTPGERSLLCTLSLLRGPPDRPRDAQEAAGIALRAKSIDDIHDAIPGAGLWAPGLAMCALAYAERIDEAEDWIARFLAWDSRSGSLTGLSADHTLMALCQWIRGRVPDQEAEGRQAIEAALQGSPAMLPFAGTLTALALVERGALTEAGDQLAHPVFDEIPTSEPAWMWIHAARGYLRLAERRYDEASDHLERAVHHTARGAWDWGPLLFGAWLVRAQAARGEIGAARRDADEALEWARSWGSPRFLGMALSADGTAQGGAEGLARLEEAVRVLAGSVSRLELARAQVEFGAALRRSNRRAEARGKLRAGMDLAVRCGADLLVAYAHEELQATGARPRRLVLSGAESLTPTERRVATLAGQGMSNREIAQALFVSHRTVEMHLSRAYRKLDIGSRDELPQAMAT